MKMSNLNQETNEEAVERILTKHLPQDIMNRLTPTEQKAIRDTVAHARWDGAVAATKEGMEQMLAARLPHRPGYPTPRDALDMEIAKQATEFEKQQAPKFLARIDSEAYPWGWRYASMDDQKLFRDFCKKQEEAKNA